MFIPPCSILLQFVVHKTSQALLYNNVKKYYHPSTTTITTTLLTSSTCSSFHTTTATTRMTRMNRIYCNVSPNHNLSFSSSSSSSSSLSFSSHNNGNNKDKNDVVTILGFGSLLSERSAKLTFPNLSNFRLGKVNNYRRVFDHPASIFFSRGIANQKTMEMSSLAAEYCPGASFICSVFEVSNENGEFLTFVNDSNTSSSSVSNDVDGTRGGDDAFVPSIAFREREEEFEIVLVPYQEGILHDDGNLKLMGTLDDSFNVDTIKDKDDEDRLSERIRQETLTTTTISSNTTLYSTPKGILCTSSSDEEYLKLWGQERFNENYKKYNINSIWNWSKDSGLRPCGPYLRHCVLAAKRLGSVCYDSFLDDTFLVDRTTTVRQYLEEYPYVMTTLPPVELADRYGG
jgi:hypothetical protein